MRSVCHRRYKEFLCFSYKKRQHKKRCSFVSVSIPHFYIGTEISLKLRRNLCSFNWLSSRDSVLVCKMHGCYQVTQKFRATFHSYPRDARRLQSVDVNNSLQKVVKSLYTVNAYSTCMINQLLYCWQIT